jgi:RNA ligase (TIGR02306 family)
MSTFRTPITIIKDVNSHPNADRLDIVKCFDFNIVTQKGKYKIGDTVLYVPIDSVLPLWLEERLFTAESKIKLNKSRVKQIRIRQFPSQGMIVEIPDIKDKLTGEISEGDDVSTILGITKYEPPAPDFQANGPRVKKERNKKHENPYFHEYNGLESVKWYPDLFEEGQEVVYTEKIHGTNGRCGLLPRVPKTLIEKVLSFFKLLPKYQFTYGSNCVQLQSKKYTGWYEENVYARMVKEYDLENKIKPNETVYYEIYGSGIQKNYTYGCKDGENKIVVFDVKILADDKQSTRWLTHDELVLFCIERGLPMVPVIYRGAHSKELAHKHTKGDSVLAPKQKIREGIVIRDPKEPVCFLGKKVLKYLSEDYLDKDNSDFH